MHILYNKNKVSYYANIKKIIEIFWPYFKKNPLYCICMGLGLLFVFIFIVDFYTWLMGITVSTENIFTFYISILTKFILVKNTISLFLLAFTNSRKDWCNIVGISVWIPVVLIPSSVFYFFLCVACINNI